MTVETLSYAIDEQDRLIKVDDGYYRFAEENGWDGAGDSLGRSLWDFVAGHEVKKLQRLLLRRMREGVRDVELPFRCDGPDVTREMDIRIAADSTGRVVLFSARLRAEEEREESQPLLDPDAPRDDERLPADVRLVRPLPGRGRVGRGRGGGEAARALPAQPSCRRSTTASAPQCSGS